jgi:hypothetical protein
MIKVGDKVKVRDQDIWGVVVEHSSGSRLVIEETDSEYEAPDNRLEYPESDLEVVPNNVREETK